MQTASILDDEFINYRSAVELAQGFLEKHADDIELQDLSLRDLAETFHGLIEEADADDAY